MSKISIVAQNYAKAIFAVAKKNGSINQIEQELNLFNNYFSVDFAKELQNPTITKPDSTKIVEEIAKNLNLSNFVRDFLIIIIRNKRIDLFRQILVEFNRLNKIEKNILEIKLISTAKIAKSHIDKIAAIFSKKYPNKAIEIIELIDQKILGGLQIKIGSNLIDASLKNQINIIKSDLKKYC